MRYALSMPDEAAAQLDELVRQVALSAAERGEVRHLTDEEYAEWVTVSVDGVLQCNDLGAGLSARKMSLDGVVSPVSMFFVRGLVRRCFTLYACLYPASAACVAAMVCRWFGLDVQFSDVTWQEFAKALTTWSKRVSLGEGFVEGRFDETHFRLGMPLLNTLTDLGRFVGYNAAMPARAEAVAWARTWLCDPIEVRMDRDLFRDGVRRVFMATDEWRPHEVDGPTEGTLSEFMLPLMTSGAGAPGYRMTFRGPDGRVERADKTKAATLGVLTPQMLIDAVRRQMISPHDVITVFVKPDELGKLRHLAMCTQDAFILGQLWTQTVSSVLRGSRLSTLWMTAAQACENSRRMVQYWLAAPGRCALPLDEAKFDEHKADWQVLSAIEMITTLAAQFLRTEEQRAYFVRLGKARAQTIVMSDVMVDGVRVGQWRKGIASGWPDTALLDTIVNVAQHYVLAVGPTYFMQAQGDDTDLVKAGLKDAKAEVAAYNASGLEVHAAKQSYGLVKVRPQSEFLRRVTDLHGDVVANEPVRLDRAGQVVRCVARSLAGVSRGWLERLIIVRGELHKTWVSGDAHVQILPDADLLELGALGWEPPSVSVVDTLGPPIDIEAGRPCIRPAQLNPPRPSVARVYGYGSRMVPGMLLRKPGVPEPKEWELRMESTTANWLRLLARGAQASTVVWFLLRELGQVSGWTPDILIAWLTTPAQVGGYGLYPYAERWVEKAVITAQPAASFSGYGGLFDELAHTAGLGSEEAAAVVHRRLRGVPMRLEDDKQRAAAKARHYKVRLAAYDRMFAPGLPCPLSPVADDRWAPVQVEMMRHALAGAVRDDDLDTARTLAIRLSERNGELFTRVQSATSRGVLKAWLTSRLPFTPAKVASWAERWTGATSARLFEQIWGGLLNRSSVGHETVLAAAIFAGLECLQEARKLGDVLFRD